jgi:RNA polymerase sigma factor (sigma-70 family)
MRDDPTVVALVQRARNGDQGAWDKIVERYGPLVWSLCARYRLFGADADDVFANVWLRLVERLDSIRNPAALPGWLASTTRNECLQLLKLRQRHVLVGSELVCEETAGPPDEWLLEQERHLALRTAFAALSKRCQALLTLLFTGPPVRYSDISADMGIPIGGIGPTRHRCLAAIRAHPLIEALAEGSTDNMKK